MSKHSLNLAQKERLGTLLADCWQQIGPDTLHALEEEGLPVSLLADEVIGICAARAYSDLPPLLREYVSRTDAVQLRRDLHEWFPLEYYENS